MTVTTTLNVATFLTNGNTTEFPYYFLVFEKEHLSVRLETLEGVLIRQYLPSEFSVTGLGANAGAVNITPAPAAGNRLSVVRVVPYLQETDIINHTAFFPETIERQFDLIVMQTQQLVEQVDRSVKAPQGELGYTLPPANTRAGKLLGWDTAGAFAEYPLTSLATSVAFATARSEVFTGTGTQTEFILERSPGTINNCHVFVDGVRQTPNIDYRLSNFTVTFITAPHDDAAILVTYVEALPLSVAAAQDVSYSQGGPGAVTSNVEKKLRESVSVLGYGAVDDDPGNGTGTDNTAAIQAAITANPGKRIRLPKTNTGNYCINSGLTILGNGTSLEFDKGARLVPTFATGDIITIGNNVTEIQSVSIRGGGTFPSVVRTSGFAIAAFLATKLRIIDHDLDTVQEYFARGQVKRHYGGIKLDGFDDVLVSGGQTVGSFTDIQMNGRFEPGNPANQSYGAEFQFEGMRRGFGYAKGIHIGGACGGIHLGRGDYSQCDTGVQIDMALAQAYNREVWLDPGFQIDVARDRGLNVESDAVALLACRGAWINSTSMAPGQGVAGSTNVRLAPSTGLSYGQTVNADFVGCDLGNAFGSGMELSQGNVLIANCRIRTNGQGAAGGHGIDIANTGCVATIRDNVFANNGNVTKGYDVNRVVGTSGSSMGNRHSGAGQGGYNLAQTSTFHITGNYGWDTAAIARTDPTLEWGLDYALGGAVKTIAASSSIDLAAGSGLLMLHDDTNGELGLFLLFAGTVTKVAGGASLVVSASPTTSQTGVTFNVGAGKYRIINGFGSSHTYVISTIRTRETS